MNPKILYTAWQSSSIAARAVALLVFVVVLIVAAGIGAKGWEHFKGREFDRRQARSAVKIGELDKQIADLKQRADEAEAKAEVAEQKAATLDAMNREQGAKVSRAAKQVDDVFDEYQREVAASNAPVPAESRRARLCEKREKLGYPCPADGQ